jgi:hypothetical protein
MSYTQIEIGGKTRGLKFNNLAVELLVKNYDGETTASFIYSMIYAGLRGNCYVKREEPDFTFEVVCEWVDTMPDRDAQIMKATSAYTDTQEYKKLIETNEENETEEDKKKALTSKTSTT